MARQGATAKASIEMSELEEMRAKLAAYEEAETARKQKGAALTAARRAKAAASGGTVKEPRAPRQPRQAAEPVVKSLEQIHTEQGEKLSADTARMTRRVQTRTLAGQPLDEAIAAVLAQHETAIRGTLDLAAQHNVSLEQAFDMWTADNAPRTIHVFKQAKPKAEQSDPGPVEGEDTAPASDDEQTEGDPEDDSQPESDGADEFYEDEETGEDDDSESEDEE